MIRPGREKLTGILEVDETYVGGADPKDGTWLEQKTVVVIATEENGAATFLLPGFPLAPRASPAGGIQCSPLTLGRGPTTNPHPPPPPVHERLSDLQTHDLQVG